MVANNPLQNLVVRFSRSRKTLQKLSDFFCASLTACVLSGQGQNRTGDTRIFSPLLYRLSYLTKVVLPLV